MQIAKSKIPGGCGGERTSACKTACSSFFRSLVAISMREAERSLARMNVEDEEYSGRFFPFPHPRSNPMHPGRREERKDDTSGQGVRRVREKCGAMDV